MSLTLKFSTALAALLLAATAVSAETRKVDESALRYYAQRNETARLEAEVRRLKALYPDWEVPTDLSAIAPAGDREKPLWDLFAADDLEGIDKAIAAMRAEDPTYEPSPDLADKLAWKRLRRDLVAASDRGDHAAVLAAAAKRPDLLGCQDLDVTWRVGEAKFRTGATAESTAVYQRVLSECTDPAGRYATVEKVLALMGASAARPLIALGRKGADGTDEFAGLKVAIARSAVSAAIAAPEAPAPLPEDLLALGSSEEAGDPALLGWWQRKAGDQAAARAAFETAVTLAADKPDILAKAVEGLVLALADLGKADEAATIARQNRDRSPALRKLFVDLGARRFVGEPRPKLPDSEIADYAAATVAERSAIGALTLGWYAHDFGAHDVAKAWFGKALSFEPVEDAARGLVIATLAAGDRAGATALKAEWGPRFAAVAAIEIPPDAPKIARRTGGGGRDPIFVAYDKGDWRGCLARAAVLGAGKGADHSLIEGWCLLKLDRPVEAVSAFARAEKAGRGRVHDDAVYGKSLALLASGQVESATSVAASGPLDGARRNEIGVAVLADRAIAQFNARRWRDCLATLNERRRFASETTDLSMMRGWALYHLGQRGEAERIFEALDQTLSTRETRAALARLRG